MSIEQFKPKTAEDLDNQLSRAELFLNGKIGNESLRTKILSMSLEEIKKRFPGEYEQYSSFLKLEKEILNFPDIDIENKEDIRVSLLPATTRGTAFKVDLGNESRVIKTEESNEEKDISKKAAELGIGPEQFETKDGLLHEEFIEGTPLLKLKEDECTEVFMEDLGAKVYKAIKKLHENNILVNDQILTNDLGKSHLIIDKGSEARIVDFGASIDITNFPDISDNAVMSLMKTDPFMMFRMHDFSNLPEEQKLEEVKGYRENILSQYQTKEDLISAIDGQLLNEGLFFMKNYLPNIASFVKGMQHVEK